MKPDDSFHKKRYVRLIIQQYTLFKNTKRIIIAIFAILILFGIQSRRKSDDKDPIHTYKIAMLAEGTTLNDMAFLQSCKDGLERANDPYLLHVEYNINTTTNQYQQRISEFTERDFDLIIAIVFMWKDAILTAAGNYPQVNFCFGRYRIIHATTKCDQHLI